MPLQKQNQRIQDDVDYLLISRAFVAFYLSPPLSHEWATCDLNLWECVFNSLSLAVCFFSLTLSPISSPLRELRPENQNFQSCLCISSSDLSKEGWKWNRMGSGAVWVIVQKLEEFWTQNWNSHHAHGVVGYSISRPENLLVFNWESILLSSSRISTAKFWFF